SSSPSNRPKAALVLPELIASSMASASVEAACEPCPCSCRRWEEHVAGRDDPSPALGEIERQAAALVERGEATVQGLVLETHLDGFADAEGALEPALAHRREPLPLPQRQRFEEIASEGREHLRPRRLRGARSVRARGAVGRSGGGAGDVAPDAEDEPVEPIGARGRGFDQDAGDLAAIEKHVVWP